jgi:hypothetical protein
MRLETEQDIKRFLKDCKDYADKLRGRNITSGPWWPIIARFTPLYDMLEKTIAEKNRLQKLIDWAIEPADQKALQDALDKKEAEEK